MRFLKTLLAFVPLLAGSVTASVHPFETFARTEHMNTFSNAQAHMNSVVIPTIHTELPKAASTHHLRKQEFIDQTMGHFDTVQTAMSKHLHMSAQAVSASCQEKLTAFQTVATRCESFLKFLDSKSKRESQTEVKTACESACSADISAGFTSISTACQNEPTFTGTDLTNFKYAASATAATCIKNDAGTEYCLPKFYTGFISLGSNANGSGRTTLDETKLNDACSPCSRKIILALSASGSLDRSSSGGSSSFSKDLVGQLQVLCQKDPEDSKYCYNKIVQFNIDGGFSKASTDDKTAAMFCSPCYMGIVGSISGGDGIGGLLDAYCAKDEKGVYCIKALTNTAAFQPKIDENTPGAQECAQSLGGASASTGTDDNVNPLCKTDACKGLMAAIFSSMGCCIPTMINAVAEYSAFQTSKLVGSSTGKASGSVDPFTQMTCGVSLGGGCARSKGVSISFSLSNLKYSYYVENKVKVDTAVQTDLANAAGVAPSSVHITGSGPAVVAAATTSQSLNFRLMAEGDSTSGTSISATINTPNDAVAAPTQTRLAAAASAGTLDLFSVNALPSSSRVDQTKTVGASGATVAESGRAGSAAGSLVASSGLITLLIAALALILA
jgi:hypothetical protein